MARENTTKYIILGLLNHEPLTGYDIRKTVEKSISNFWSEISYGQIYPTLKQLENNDLVSKQVDVQENRPLRKIYTITSKGKEELQAWLETPTDREVMKLDILLKLFFGAQTSMENNQRSLQEFKDRKMKYLELLKLFETDLRKVLEENEDHIYYLLTVRFGQHMTQAQLTWADEALQMLQERTKNI